MKYILIIIFLMQGICSQAQTTAQQLSSLRAQDVIINKSIAELNAAIVKMLSIVAEYDNKIAKYESKITEQDAKIAAIPAHNNTEIIKLLEFQTHQSLLNKSLLDSITTLRKSIPAYLVLYVDTMTGLRFKKDTLYFKK